jgi:hypothetical protein
MSTQYLNYKTNKGTLSVEISIENIPMWDYRYRFDTVIENDTAKNDPKNHTLNPPPLLLTPEHRWSFLLTNIAAFPAPNVRVKMDWYQDQDGQKVHIHQWYPDAVDIDPVNGKKIEGRVILNPQL